MNFRKKPLKNFVSAGENSGIHKTTFKFLSHMLETLKTLNCLVKDEKLSQNTLYKLVANFIHTVPFSYNVKEIY